MSVSGPPLQIPCVSLGTFITQRCDEHGERIALIDPTTDRKISFAELSSQVRRLCRGLQSIGVKKGDTVCMFCPNVVEYAAVFLAVASLGGVFQATNPLSNAGELQHTLDLCKPRFLLTVPPLLPTVRQTSAEVQIIVLGEAEGCISLGSLMSDSFSKDPIDQDGIDPKEDVVAILFSSGTTGKPKAVQITHHALVANVLQMETSVASSYKHTLVTFIPFFHIYGLDAILTAGLYLGSTNVVMSRFQPQDYLNNIQKYKATTLHVVPPVLVFFSRYPDIVNYDLSSVREIACGAAPLSKDVEAKILQIFNLKYIFSGYGMTESQVTHTVKSDAYKFGSVGLLLPGLECKIVDVETQSDVGRNTDGEVCLRGPSLMKGYLSNPGATDAMFTEDGWMRTGDVGHIDDEGFLFIVDRLKELIKYKGFQVAPAELEDILLSHADVADVGVIGVPDVEAGELPKAFVVRKANSTVAETDLVKFVDEKVSGTKKLRGGVTFVTEIPKSASGKILRRVLREKHGQS